MNRRNAIRTAIIATPLVAVLLYIALNWYRFEPEPVWVNAGPEARENRFLALARFLERMGARVTVAKSPSVIDGLPPKATLLIGARRLAYMTPDHVKRLLTWVDRGGHLVVEAESWGMSDPLLKALGVHNALQPPDFAKGATVTKGPITPPYTEAPMKFEWPGAPRELRANFMPVSVDLRDERSRPQVTSIVLDKLTLALAFDEGAGHVTVLPNLGFLVNGRIGKFDHAEFAWLALGEPAHGASVTLFLKMDSAPLSEWIWQEAWAVVIASALLLALWLARIIPRFGPLVPEAEPVRRSLAEHIIASGRFLASRGELGYLLDAVRERVMRTSRRRGVAPGATPSQAATAISRLAAIPEGEARVALGSPPANEAQFISSVAALHRIESRLARPAPSKPGRKKART